MRYAQIDLETGVCLGVSILAGEVDAPHMILLADSDDVNPRDVWDGVKWSPAPPLLVPEPQPTPEQVKIAQLEQESADLKQAVAELTMLMSMPTNP